MLQALRALIRTCQAAHAPVLSTLLAFYWRKRHRVNLLAHPNTRVEGIHNLSTRAGVLNVGVSYVGFTLNSDAALLSLRGPLVAHGEVAIGKGCRIAIGPAGRMEIGNGSYINPNTLVVAMHGVTIGKSCAISWECQFLDEDFHGITLDGQTQPTGKEIVVGDHVWIGSRVSVLKGAVIPSGCIVASGAVVTKAFTEENCLIGGVPATIIRRDIKWA